MFEKKSYNCELEIEVPYRSHYSGLNFTNNIQRALNTCQRSKNKLEADLGIE